MSGYRWRQLVASLRTPDAVCWICGHSIDIELKFPAPGSFTVHHRVPRSKGGDLLDRANAVPAHLRCNSSLGNRPLVRRRRTSRRW
ncbi:HNH endonuclease [Saccharopolyspora shandongensis]|nr:HNH endonuclease [Saccharopolyspora shandongensis]